ncbi:hypothetical protein SEUCBS140593_002821 [Sporothrix eucalyptigena]|uniref:Uncharacterized protein n=1 Tax=Sporothrix eucalyptigena TaxID=1812306 RepID=A0ABP0B9Q3_9PEZI
MNMDSIIYTGKPIEYLESLDDTERRLFFFVLDYITDHIIHRREFPSTTILDTLTSRTHITSYVRSFIHHHDWGTLRQKVAALQALKPLFLAVPPGQATSHRISAPGPVKKTDAPLSGAILLDGCATPWKDRLKEQSKSYYSETSGPLILNYYEARQIRAEYASLEFKPVAPGRGSDFPHTIPEQQKLVGTLYDAIMNMDDILEKKRPILLKKSANKEESHKEVPSIPESRKRTALERDEDENDNDSFSSQYSGEGGENDSVNSQPVQTDNATNTADKPKETISVVKVKSLSRIEVEMLCWEILHTIRDVDRGQLPFMSWSGRDWGWDSQFSTFHERFEAVATTLRRSKAAVCSLLESDYMARLAAHPRREYRRKENNRSQNAERNAQVFVGRHAIGTGQVQVGMTGDLQDRDGNVVAAAGTVHNGLIEQTRKLGEIGRRDAAAKKAKLAATTFEKKIAGTATDTTTAENAPSSSAQQKPRVRRRKSSALEMVVKMTSSQQAKAGIEKTEASEAAETSHREMLQFSDMSQAIMEQALSSSSSMILPLANPVSEGFAVAPVTPGLWPDGSSTMTTAVPTPKSSFSPLPPSWASNYGTLLPNNDNLILACPTVLVDYRPFVENATVNTSLVNESNYNMATTEFPSVTNSFNLLNSGVNVDLPSHSKPVETVEQEANTNIQPNGIEQQELPDMNAETPRNDVFSMNIAINSSNNSEHINRAVLDKEGAICMGMTGAGPISSPGVMLPTWEADVQDIMHQLEIYSDTQLNLELHNTAATLDTVPSDNNLAMDMNIDMDLRMCAFNTNMLAMQDERSFTDVTNGVSSSIHVDEHEQK